jgi:ATP-dependent RNA helicase RhlE
VRHVYNYDLPNVPENYVHRIGRTARAGAEGNAIAFCAPAEMGELQAIEKVLKKQIPVVGGAPWAADVVAAAPKPNQNRGGRPGGRPGQGAGQGKPQGGRPEYKSQAPKPQPRQGAKPARPAGGGQSPTRSGNAGKPRPQGNRRPA